MVNGIARRVKRGTAAGPLLSALVTSAVTGGAVSALCDTAQINQCAFDKINNQRLNSNTSIWPGCTPVSHSMIGLTG